MASVKRNTVDLGADRHAHRPIADHGYQAGGPIASLQAEIAARLNSPMAPDIAFDALPANRLSPAESMTRFFSVAGGYGSLVMAYAVTGWAVVHFI